MNAAQETAWAVMVGTMRLQVRAMEAAAHTVEELFARVPQDLVARRASVREALS